MIGNARWGSLCQQGSQIRDNETEVDSASQCPDDQAPSGRVEAKPGPLEGKDHMLGPWYSVAYGNEFITALGE